ncbi:MAG: hypothetical protein OSA97_07585 [Nevskia sp.]|nr:hypothetical protein [Nevskia sp.]
MLDVKKSSFGLLLLAGLAACGQNMVCIGTDTLNCPAPSSSSSSGGSSSSSSSSGGTGSASTGFVNPSSITLGNSTKIGVDITNSSSNAVTGVGTTVEFPSSFSINVAPSYNCPPGTVTTSMPDASTVEVTLSNATVPGATTCELATTVTPSTKGQFPITAAGQSLTLTVN